jgi:hypothetical protein
MRLNPSPSRFTIKFSPLFETAEARLSVAYPFLGSALDDLEAALLKTPYSEGEPCPAFPDRDFRVRVSPRTARLPGLRVLYEIEDPRVVCWAISERH